MSYFFNPSTSGFYRDDIHQNIPSDAVAVTDEEHAAAFIGQSEGKKLVVMAGKVVAVEPPPPSAEEIAANVRQQRDERLADVTWRVTRYTTQAAAGSATTDSAEAYQAVLTYMQALRDVTEQVGFPTEIVWPSLPE